tara:strand:- start:6354 stop:6494 length:141 start_codon:yes stop_codon:yes gene_type:complete
MGLPHASWQDKIKKKNSNRGYKGLNMNTKTKEQSGVQFWRKNEQNE